MDLCRDPGWWGTVPQWITALVALVVGGFTVLGINKAAPP